MDIRHAFAASVLFAASAAVAAPLAQIERVDGKGEYREARQTAWSAAKPAQSLNANDFVRTLELSRMAIVYRGGTRSQLSANSLMQVIETEPDKASLNLQKGRGWFNAPTPAKGMEIKTPSATAAIRGTEWEIVVDDDGRSTLSVFAGEVSLYNELGNVSVGANEQAVAERGKAPVKLTLRVSRERVQWVSSFTVDARRYGAGAVPEVERMMEAGELAEAYDFLTRKAESAAAILMLADFEVYRGDLAAAERALLRGVSAYPQDERFDVGLARIALLDDRSAQALERARAASARRPQSVEALLALGDIERHEGRAREAIAAYSRAAAMAARDARPWHGLGVVESERENVRRARSHLAKAIALDPSGADHAAELGTLESFAGNFDAARKHLQAALALQPGNYVAWTGLGVVELKSGHLDAAMDALSRAASLEPRYARAHLYLAAVLYELGRDKATLDTLARAAELDPRDPLPHLLASIVYLDRVEPGLAALAAERALERMPFLKSLNPVANNQKGVANVGYPLALMGLEARARSAAQDSYLPFWGGSHLFLADRYAGEFNRRSELMLGFVTDPLVFGASNRFQSLVPVPGHHATVSMHANASDDLSLLEPVVTVNGYHAGDNAVAYFAEAAVTRVEPGNTDFEARMRRFSAAVGFKPTHELGAFLYVNHFSADVDIGPPAGTGDLARIRGSASRVDAGVRYAPDAASSLWVKAGASEQDSTNNETLTVELPNIALQRAVRYTTKPKAEDVAARYTRIFAERWEATVGAESARMRTVDSLIGDTNLHALGASGNREHFDLTDTDRSQAVYAVVRTLTGRLRFEAGGAWRDYKKDRHSVHGDDRFPGDVNIFEKHRRRRGDPMLGIVWQPVDPVHARFACRRWVRPASLDTMMPVAIAGLPLDDQLVFPGGEIEQCRAQVDWALSRRSFAMLAAEHIETRNLFSPFAGILNTQADVTNVERLRNRLLAPPPKPDQLEEIPVYAGAIIRRAHAAFEQLVTPRLGARAHYTYADSENNDYPLFAGKRVPYLARHQVNLGLTWTPGWRTIVTAQAVHRSARFADESNVRRLPAGWDGYVNVFVESADKRWALEVQAQNLLKKETSDVFGIVLSYRF